MAINRSICLVFMVTKHVEQSRAAISALMRLSTAQLGCRRQAVLAVDVDHLADDGQAHEHAHDFILLMVPGQGSDDASTDVLTAEY